LGHVGPDKNSNVRRGVGTASILIEQGMVREGEGRKRGGWARKNKLARCTAKSFLGPGNDGDFSVSDNGGIEQIFQYLKAKGLWSVSAVVPAASVRTIWGPGTVRR